MHFGAPPSLTDEDEPPCLPPAEEALWRNMRRWLSVASAMAREGDFLRNTSMGMAAVALHVARFVLNFACAEWDKICCMLCIHRSGEKSAMKWFDSDQGDARLV